MLRRRCGIFAALAIFYFAANTMAQAQDVSKGSWWTEPSVVQTLNLTDNEVEQLEKEYWEYRSSVRLLKSEIRYNQREIDNWMARNSSNPQGKKEIIQELEGKIEKARSLLPKAEPAFVTKVRAILGPERYEKLLTLEP